MGILNTLKRKLKRKGKKPKNNSTNIDRGYRNIEAFISRAWKVKKIKRLEDKHE